MVVFAKSNRNLPRGNVDPMSTDFAARLNRLFEMIPGPDGRTYSNDAVIAGIAAKGGPAISKGYLSELRTGKKTNPTLKHIEALSTFFDVDPTYFVGDADYAKRVESELRLLAGMKRAGVRDIAMRASQLNESELSLVEAILETVIQQHEEAGDDPGSG